MRTRVTIQVNSAAGTRDSRGQEIETWTTFVTGWAEVEPDLSYRGGKEISAAQQQLAEQFYTVLMRFRSDVRPKMRMVFGTHTLDIISVLDPDRRRHKMVLRALERGSSGTTT